ncbi:MAG: hypothetical protein FWG14_04810 [Peptococcaceae bacterium]|nr:hypothetical protein [Peptococcaceae bacterium]
MWIFRADGTCEDYAPDYEDPYYGSHMNCTYYIGNDSLTNSPNSLILKYLDDDGEEAEEDYLWNSEGSRMQWYVTADTLRIGGFEYTRK